MAERGGTVTLDQLPPPEPSAEVERTFFSSSTVDYVDLVARRIVLIGALVIALVLYALGVLAILAHFGVISVGSVPKPLDWRHYVTTIVALFTVPTILTVAVLKSTGKASAHESSDGPQEAALSRALGVIETMVDRP